MTKNEMVGWLHRLNGHEFEQALGVGDGQGSLACCSPWGHKELDTTEQLNHSRSEIYENCKQLFFLPSLVLAILLDQLSQLSYFLLSVFCLCLFLPEGMLLSRDVLRSGVYITHVPPLPLAVPMADITSQS